MAVDTVKLRSPEIDEGTAQFLEHQCVLKQGIDLASGEVLYEITTGSLRGSWDSRISFKVCREDWIVGRSGKPEQVACNPYVMIEASVHKFFYGQNIYGNPVGFQFLCKMFIELLSEMFSDENYPQFEKHRILPSAARWQVRRVDWAEMFNLSSSAQVEFFRGLKNCKFPRRALKEAKYDTAVHFPGKFTTFRIYGKGAEFKKHDLPRLKQALMGYLISKNRKTGKIFDHDDYLWIERKLKALQRLANQRLRVEVQINSDKLHHDFTGRYPLVSEITDDYLINIYQEQVFKLLREGKSEMETVRTYDAVQVRLANLYGSRSANVLFAFWLKLAARGEEVVRLDYQKSQFYSNRKKLVDSGISWHSSDVLIVTQETALPRDFVPLVTDIRRCKTSISANSVFNHCPIDFIALRNAA